MKKTIVIIGTLDTKGEEVAFLNSLISGSGHKTIIIDTGILNEPLCNADISRNKIARAGGSRIESLVKKGDESYAQKIMAEGLRAVVDPMVKDKKIQGLLAIGGGQGSVIASSTLKSLPLGFPKMLISTKVTQAGLWPYIGAKDVMILPPVADLAGINRVTRHILNMAAGAMIGMVETEPIQDQNAPLAVLSMNGSITICGLITKKILEEEGYEVLVFHSIGTGGFALEEYVSSCNVQGVIELAVNEIASDLLGGLASAGPKRLEAAGEKGIPQIIVPGCADTINFLGPETVPAHYKNRKIHSHNPQATLVRTNAHDNVLIGKTIALKLNKASAPAVILWPKRGLSSHDCQGKPFWDPETDSALLESLKSNIDTRIPIIEIDANVNDDIFGKSVAFEFLKMMKQFK